MERYSKEDLLGVLPTAIINSKELTAKQKIVLGQLWVYNGLEEKKKNGYFYRSNKDLCNDCSIHENTLITSVRKLESLGFIERKKGNRTDGASEYCVNEKLINDYCKNITANCSINCSNNCSENCSKQIAEMSSKIRQLEETIKILSSKIAVIEAINCSNNCSENCSTDTEEDIEIEKEVDIDENKKKKILKEKKVETAKDFKLNFDDILLSEENSINESFVSIENDIDQQTNTSSNEVVINEQVEEGASIRIEASESPVTNNTSSNEELYEQVMAKIKLSIDGFREFNTENDLKAHSSYTKKMLEFYSKGNKTVSDKAMEYLKTEYCKNLDRINSISRHQYVAGQGFKTLK